MQMYLLCFLMKCSSKGGDIDIVANINGLMPNRYNMKLHLFYTKSLFSMQNIRGAKGK